LVAKSFDYGTLADATLSHVKQLCIGFMHSNLSSHSGPHSFLQRFSLILSENLKFRDHFRFWMSAGYCDLHAQFKGMDDWYIVQHFS